MKLNVKKYQQGGIFSSLQLPNYLLYQPAPGMGAGSSQESSSESSSKSKSKKDDDEDFKLLSQKVVDELITKGLPNEVSYFLNELAEYEQSNNGIFSATTSRAKLYSLANLASNMLNNRKEYDKAVDIMKANESFSDYAVSNDGGVYVTDVKNGKTKHISLSEYKKHEDKYNVLTYGDLLESRAYEPDSRFKSGIFTTLKESVGVHKIAQNIQEIVKMLGSNEVTKEDYITANEAFGIRIQQMTPSEKEAMQLLNNYASLGDDALFKLKTTEKGYSDANAALKYIYSVLPENQKKQLMANYVINGGEDNNPVNVIKNAIMMSEDKKSEYDVDLDKTSVEKQASTRGTQRPISYMEQFLEGNVNRSKIEFTDPSYKNGYSIQLEGNITSGLPADNNESVHQMMPMTLALDYNNNGIGKYLDYNQTYCGTNKIHHSNLQNIMFDGENSAKVWMPIDSSGNIDFSSLSAFSQAKEKIKQDGIDKLPDSDQKAQKINKVFQDFGLKNITVDATGKFIQNSRMGEFLLAYGYTEDSNLIKNNLFVKKLSNSEEDYINPLMEQIYKTYKIDDPTEYFTNTHKVPVLIKINPNAHIDAKTLEGHGSMVNKTTLEDDILSSQMVMDKSQNGFTQNINASSDLIFAQ